MASTTRITPIRQLNEVALSGAPEEQARLVAASHRALVAEAERTNAGSGGGTLRSETFVDGRAGAPLESVRPGGSIVTRFDLAGDVLEWIDAMLVLHAPVRSGRFAKSFVCFADGVECDPLNPPQAEVYAFTNVQPYTRKLERGASSMAPDGVFEAVAALAAGRFGNAASIRFAYRSLAEGAIDKWAASATADRLARATRGGRQRLHAEWLRRHPRQPRPVPGAARDLRPGALPEPLGGDDVTDRLAVLDGLIGRPYALGASGPEAFDCYGLARHVQATLYAVDLPELPRRPATTREQAEAMLAHPERSRWTEVSPTDARDGDLVLMGNVARRDFHLGTFVVPVTAGVVLHTDPRTGVVADDVPSLRGVGWNYLRLFRRT